MGRQRLKLRRATDPVWYRVSQREYNYIVVLGQAGTTCDNLKLSGTTRDNPGQRGQPGTTGDNWGQPGTTGDNSRQPGTTGTTGDNRDNPGQPRGMVSFLFLITFDIETPY